MEEPFSVRRMGRTTRLADEAIQALFTYSEVIIRDHHLSQEATTLLLNIVRRRLQMEHPGVEFQVNKKRGNHIISIDHGI